jgi:hypothetical protein
MRTSALSRVLGLLTAASLLVPHAYASPGMYPQCSDGIDNDGDSFIDYPEDQNCTTINDISESPDEGVFVTLTDGHDRVSPGEALTYVITLKQQRDPVKLVDVSFHVPAQNAISSTSDGGAIQNGTIFWNKVAVFKDSIRTLTVHVAVSPTVTPGQLLVSQVRVADRTATDTTMVNNLPIPYPQNQLVVAVSDHRDNALPGDMLDYIVSVRNPEKNAATVHVRVKIPAALHVVDSQGATFVNDEIVWMNVTINPGQERVMSFRAQVDSRLPNRYPIQVVARAGNVVGYDRTISGSAGGAYNLFASITDNQVRASRGDLLTYWIHVDNTSGRLDTDANITASLPQYAEFVSANEGGNWDGKNVRWMHMQVAPGSSRDLSYTIRVRGDAPDGTSLRATATVQGATVSDTTQVGGGVLSTANRSYRVATSYQPSYQPPHQFAYAVPTDGVLLPQTGVEDFFGPIENVGQFLSPIGSATDGNALPLVIWIALAIAGVAGGTVIGKKYVI